MGSGMYSKKEHHHKSFHQRNGNPAAPPSTNKIFLPILCTLSIRDSIALAPHPRSKNVPSSPKVSCMGQVKRHHHRHLTPSSTTAVKQQHNKCDQRRRRTRQLPTKLNSSSSSSNGHENKCGAVVPVLNLAQLDPPLPVMKKLPPQPSVSLWKRRSREDGQLTNIQIPTFHCTCSIQKSLQLEPPASASV